MITENPNNPALRVVAFIMALCLAFAAPAQEDAPAGEDVVADSDAAAETAEPAPAAKANPRRADSYGDAVQAAGADGVAVFCYGPNWNRRSTQMLSTFWKTPALEAATGKAILVAVPYYQDPTPEQQAETQNAASGMRGPSFGVCPTVMLFDSTGTLYASLVGTDQLGTDDEEFKTGYDNLRKYIGYLHERDALLTKAHDMPNGVEKAKVLSEIADLPIASPPGLVEMIRAADPSDESGMVRRNDFNALKFLYEQMGTKDGFLSPDFVVDFKSLEAACLKVAKDEALRPKDRQAAYLLLIGASRRNGVTGTKLKALISACAKIAPQSEYGRLSPHLSDKWASIKPNLSAEDRRHQRQQDREKNKDRRKKEKDENRTNKSSEVR